MTTPGIVVYLNGIACAGKSTLAAGLQAAWPEPFLHVGLDALTSAMPDRFLGDGADADAGARWITGADRRLIRVEPGPFGMRLLAALPRMAAALARCGNHVVVDDVLLYPWRVGDVADAMGDLHAHFVEVRCDRDVARARGSHRPGRGTSTGMIDAYYDDTYRNDRYDRYDRYDLSIDTGRADPTACVERLVRYLRAAPEPKAFSRIRAAP